MKNLLKEIRKTTDGIIQNYLIHTARSVHLTTVEGRVSNRRMAWATLNVMTAKASREALAISATLGLSLQH